MFGTSSPQIIKVAECESSLRQYDNTGNILRGVQNPADIGVLQINESIHSKELTGTTTNIYIANGNILFAKYLYNQFGLQPWLASKKCWSKVDNST